MKYFSLLLCLIFFSGKILAQNSDFSSEAKLTDLNVVNSSSGEFDVMLTFDKPVVYKSFSLPEPARLVLDFSRTQFAVAGIKALNFNETPIQDFRHGIQDGYNLRLVFDLRTACHYKVESHEGNTFQIILHVNSQRDATRSNELQMPLVRRNDSTQNTHSSLPQMTAVSKAESPSDHHSVKSDIQHELKNDINSDIKNEIPHKETIKINHNDIIVNKKNPENNYLNNPPKKSTFVVVIDAGHGGKDPGATGSTGLCEKNITLAIAKDLESLINSQSGMKAVLTRKEDYYVGLRRRLMLARQAKGDVFIAIHADAFDSSDAEGASVYALSLHGSTSEAALWLSQKENYSEIGNIDLGNIEDNDLQLRSVLIDLSQTATISASLQLGRDTLSQLGKITDLHHGVVEQAPFMVLKSPDIPSILVETGFITDPKEEARLSTKNYQEKLAQALFLGLKSYYQHSVNMSDKVRDNRLTLS